jgi:hypothetical protein
MPHRRDEIINTVCNLLLNKTIALDKVYTHPKTEYQSVGENNAIFIFCPKEVVVNMFGNINYARETHLHITITSNFLAQQENPTHAIAKNIEAEIANFSTKEFLFTYGGIESEGKCISHNLYQTTTTLLYTVAYTTNETKLIELDNLTNPSIEVKNGII